MMCCANCALHGSGMRKCGGQFDFVSGVESPLSHEF